MIEVAIAVAFVLLIVIGVARAAVVIVPTDSAYVVRRLGGYGATLSPGFHIIAPRLGRGASRHSLAPQTEELSDTCTTSDHRRVRVSTSFRLQVLAPEKAAYG